MVTIPVTADERAEGELTPTHREMALQALQEDGFVVLQGIVDPEHIRVLREKMLEDLSAVLARPDAPFNFNSGNLQQDPPPMEPYLFRDVLLNDLVIDVTRHALRSIPTNAYYSGNTALSGGERQPVHPDVAQLWPDMDVPTPAFGLVINVPLVDVSAENGATEVWPGTHHNTQYWLGDGSARIKTEHLDARREVRAPVQPSYKAGDVLIRDIRLWHAGMPNGTTQPRPMIAMIHWADWWGHKEFTEFPRQSEAFFSHPHLNFNVKWIDGEVDYLHHNQAYDFQK